MSRSERWRSEFPVSWTDDARVSRRSFTRALASISCATLAAGSAAKALESSPAPIAPTRIGAIEDLPVGSAQIFEYPGPGEPCLLIRLASDRFVAYSQRCTHLACPVYYREADRTLHCPCHEGLFDAADGRVLAGPPPRPLPRVKLEQRGGELWAVGWDA